MTNPDNQKRLDRKKWFASEQEKKDKSGDMEYCEKCEHATTLKTCSVTQDYREKTCCCATAYNRMKRGK